MSYKAVVARITALGGGTLGTFSVADAVALGVSRKQLAALREARVIERVFPGVYRVEAVPPSNEQYLRAALAWAGPGAVAAGSSAGELYALEGVAARVPEIVVPAHRRARSDAVVVHRTHDRAALMVRSIRGIPVTGIEPTLVALAHRLAGEAFEIACEDARRRRLTSVAAMQAFLDRWGRRGRPGVAATRALMSELDPRHASRSALEVKARRLLVANGFCDFVREFPLGWKGRTYRYDFGFPAACAILETNGRRWHDDPNDYEYDNEKWSVPARHGFRIVFATWAKVTRTPGALLAEVEAALRR